MKTSLYKHLASLAIVSSALVAPLLGQTEAVAEMSTRQAKQRLLGLGLQPVDQCFPSLVMVYIGETRSVCAIPNTQYPAGVYRLDPNTYQMYSVGGGSVNGGGNRGVIVQPVAPTVIPPDPTMVYMPNPIQPIPTYVQARLATVRSTHQLSPASCGSFPNLVTITVNNTYRMCAYPNASYPGGTSYSVSIPNLGSAGYPAPNPWGNSQMIQY